MRPLAWALLAAALLAGLAQAQMDNATTQPNGTGTSETSVPADGGLPVVPVALILVVIAVIVVVVLAMAPPPLPPPP
jgi:hypothetical protein